MSQALLRSNKESRLSSSNVTPIENFETLYIRSFFAPLEGDGELPLGCLVLSAIQLFTYGSSANSLWVKEKTAKIKQRKQREKKDPQFLAVYFCLFFYAYGHITSS